MKCLLSVCMIGMVFALPASAATSTSSGQAYPDKPIRFIAGVTPGGATDIRARAVGARLVQRFNQQVVIDNRPGANQTIAAEIVTRAAPDGHTSIMVPADYEVSGWYGVLSPAGIPKPVVAKLNAEFKLMLEDARMRESLPRERLDPLYSTPEAFGKIIAVDIAKWAKVVKPLNINAD